MSPTSRPRTVLVTGAAKRLGRSIALALAAGGWQVAVHYRASAQDAIVTVAACADLAGASAHFDADFAEAITQIPAPSDDLKGKIVDVVEKGYKLGDKIIRFPKVVIGQ